MRERHVWIVMIAILASTTLGSAQSADTILYNGKILTVDKNFRTAKAVAIRKNEIAAVGTDDEVLKLAGSNTLKIDLKGRTVIPGLIDTHRHIESPGGYAAELTPAKRKTYPLNFRAVKTKDDVLKQIREIITAFKFKPGEWIFFPSSPRGDQAKLILDELTAAELDKAAPDNPIVVGTGMPIRNMSLVNGKAIQMLWAKYGNFIETYGRYWVDANGKPSGILETPAVRLLWEDAEFNLSPAPADVAPLYKKLLEERSAWGITTLSAGLNTSTVEAYQYLDARGEMPVRYGYGAMAGFGPNANMKQHKLGAGSDTVFITSLSARAVDGAGARMCISLKRDAEAVAELEGENLSMMGLAAGSSWWPRGQCSLDIEYKGGTRGARIKGNYFVEWYSEVAREGSRSANSHVSGNDSHSRLLTEWEKIDRARPGAVKGWAMDHCDLIEPSDIPRAAKLGVIFSCSAWSQKGEEYAKAFGEPLVHTHMAPVKSLLDAGITVSLEGEGGATYWDNVETLITRADEKGKVWGPDQRVDRATALKMATQNGAHYVLKGNKLGSIEPGKLADLVVLDRDYMTVPESDISEIRSLMTVMGGRVIFLRTDFSNEYNLKPAGTVISTYEELVKRAPRTPGGNE